MMWNLIGTLVYAACQWAILVAAVRLSSMHNVGLLSLGFAVTAPIFLFFQFRLRAAAATDALHAFSPADYICLRSLCTLLSIALTVAICAGGRWTKETTTIIAWVAVAKAIESGSDLMYGFSQQAGNLKAVGLSMIARGIVGLGCFAYALASTHQLSFALMSLCGAWSVVLVCLDLPAAVRGFKRAQQSIFTMPRNLAALTKLTAPLGVSAMLMSLTANMPRYFVVHALGDSALGIFSATSYLAMAASVAISAIAESKVTQLSQLLAFGSLDKATRLLKATIRITLTLSAASLLGSAVLGKWILQRAYHYEHSGAVGLLMLMMLIAGVADLASVQGYALLAARRFRSYTATLIVSAAVCAVGCSYGVAAGGLRGAAFGCLAGYVAQLVVSAWMMRSVLRPARSMAVSLRHVAITEG